MHIHGASFLLWCPPKIPSSAQYKASLGSGFDLGQSPNGPVHQLCDVSLRVRAAPLERLSTRNMQRQPIDEALKKIGLNGNNAEAAIRCAPLVGDPLHADLDLTETGSIDLLPVREINTLLRLILANSMKKTSQDAP